MQREELRRWVHARRDAEARERAEARVAPPVRDSVGAALALIAVAGGLHGWPPPEDAVSRREDALARERWAKLRRRLSGRWRRIKRCWGPSAIVARTLGEGP